MAESQLVLHRGARPVSFEELSAVPAPPAEGRWRPIPHVEVVQSAKQTLQEFGYSVHREQYGLSRGDARFFGTLDLSTSLVDGVALAVGIRSSIDKSFPLGFCAGSRVFCCDNLAFSSELMVRRKHTTHATVRFREDIAQAVGKISGYRDLETMRIQQMRSTTVSTVSVESLILRMFERGIVPARHLQRVLSEFRTPSFEEFKDQSYWALFNAVTTAIGDTAQGDPQRYALRTMRLSSLLSQDSRLN